MAILNINHRRHFTIEYLQPAINEDIIEMNAVK